MERYECFHVACRFCSAATTQRVRRVVALDHELCFEWVMLISILVTFQFLQFSQNTSLSIASLVIPMNVLERTCMDTTAVIAVGLRFMALQMVLEHAGYLRDCGAQKSLPST